MLKKKGIRRLSGMVLARDIVKPVPECRLDFLHVTLWSVTASIKDNDI